MHPSFVNNIKIDIMELDVQVRVNSSDFACNQKVMVRLAWAKILVSVIIRFLKAKLKMANTRLFLLLSEILYCGVCVKRGMFSYLGDLMISLT